jgi:ankyrin repeat protein
LLHLDIHPLHATINEKNGLEGLWLMINSGVDLKSFKDSWNPLMDICKREEDQGFMNILFAYCKILIKNGIDVNYINPDNETPLFAASVRGHKNIAKLLLDNGAEKNLASCFLFEDYKSIHSIKNRSSTINHEAYVLCMAAAKGNIELLKNMKNHGVDLNTSMIDKFGDVMTALNYVTNKSTTEWLLQNGATPIKTDNNQIASGELCRATNDFEGTEKIELLLKAGANANDKDSYTLATALHASLNSWMPYNKAKLLLDYGADITARDKDQLSAMHYLLSNEASDHSSEINYGKGGSSFATEEEILNTIDLLIEYGADAKLKDIAGNTPLHMAAKRGYGEKVIKKLIDLGNDPQEKNLYGENPAIRAAKHFKHEAFNLLASSTDNSLLVYNFNMQST